MSTTSQIDVQIGCTGQELQEKYQPLSVKFTIQQAKINDYNKYIQKQLSLKKTPILVIEYNSSAQKNENPIKVDLFGNEFQLKQKGKTENKRILYGDIKDQDKLLFMRKVQRLFHLLTQLHIDLNLNIQVYDAHAKQIKAGISLSQILRQVKVKGELKMDQKGPDTLKKCLIKVSPKFVQSPIFVFFELFSSLNFKLQLQSLDFLQDQQETKLLSKLFNLKPENSEIKQILKKSEGQTKITICLQKLILLQISGAASLISLILPYL